MLCGCHSTFRAETLQANPIAYLGNQEVINQSNKLFIKRGGMNLYHFKMVSYAKFVLISRDRIRFRIEMSHQWERKANPCVWKNTLYIDGAPYVLPCEKEGKTQFVTKIFDIENRRVLRRNQFGEPIQIERYERNPTQQESIDIYVGKAFLSLYKRDVVTKKTKEVSLKMVNGNITYWFVWKLFYPKD